LILWHKVGSARPGTGGQTQVAKEGSTVATGGEGASGLAQTEAIIAPEPDAAAPVTDELARETVADTGSSVAIAGAPEAEAPVEVRA